MTALLQGKRKTEKKGRGGDEILAHLTSGEIVIPKAFAKDYEFRTILTRFFKENKADLRQFIVGDGKNKVNPKTGYLEFGWISDIGKSFKKVYKEVSRWEKDIFGKAGKELKRVEQKISREAGRALTPEFPKIIPPELPSPVPTVSQMRRGTAERRRKRRRTTIFAGRRALAPASVSQAELKTTFG